MKTLLLTLLFLISFICLTSQSWALPPCQGNHNDYRHNCYGSYTWKSGDIYLGEWKNDKWHGQGTYIYSNGDKYIGEYKNNKKNGKGTYTYGLNSEWAGDKYIGELKDGKKHGQGTYTWKSGNKHIGKWKNGKRDGQGTFTWTDGNIYIGQYKDDKRNGQGTLTYADGTIKKGIWKDGHYIADSDGSFGKSPSNSKIEGYKNFCSEIGFTPGTEKFGECVVEAMKKG